MVTRSSEDQRQPFQRALGSIIERAMSKDVAGDSAGRNRWRKVWQPTDGRRQVQSEDASHRKFLNPDQPS